VLCTPPWADREVCLERLHAGGPGPGVPVGADASPGQGGLVRPYALIDVDYSPPTLAAQRRLLSAARPRRRDHPPRPRRGRVGTCIRRAWTNPTPAARQSFNSVCTRAFTLHGYAEVVGSHFGREPRLEFVPWNEFVTRVDAAHADTTLEHIERAPRYSMDKARTLLGFVPKHDVTDTVLESIDVWIANRN
jgi:hypothetical protein